MAANKMFIAIVLLTGPDPTADMRNPADMQRMFAPAIQQVAIKWEILDPRETGYVLAEPGRFEEDLQELRRRYKELAGAPPVAEALRFPDYKVANKMQACNRSYEKELRQRLIFDNVHREEIEMALQETERLYRIWDKVHEARRRYFYITVRRQALRELRQMIGDAAFYSGQLPPPVPLWRLPRVH